MMGIVSILKTVGTIGATTVPTLVGSVNPGLGMLMTTTVNSVLKTEAAKGPGGGETKLEHALDLTDTAVPFVVSLIEGQTGRPIQDQVLFAQGVRDLHQAVVELLKAFDVLPGSPPKP